MSDTPETDANIDPHLYNFVRAKFARKLERERDEAREAIRALAEHGESEIQRITKERDEALNESLEQARLLGISGEWGCRLIAERDEAREEQEKYKAWAEDSKRNAAYSVELYYQEAKKARAERDEAREQVKELIYIGERAIELADLDFENDKFGVVSELRNDLEKIKKSK
jgi:hypothetical protein